MVERLDESLVMNHCCNIQAYLGVHGKISHFVAILGGGYRSAVVDF